MATGNTAKVKTIFGRCLLSCPSVDLWQTYLTFIQKVNHPYDFSSVAIRSGHISRATCGVATCQAMYARKTLCL